MNISSYNKIINRNRLVYLKKELYKNTININKLTAEKDILEQSRDTIQTFIIAKKNDARIKEIDENIVNHQKSINNINKQLLNNGNFTTISLFNNHNTTQIFDIYKTHRYTNLEPTTFAPSYPLRFKK